MDGGVPTERDSRVEGEDKVTEIKTLMRQTMDRLSTENRKADGRLLADIGNPNDISRAQVFQTPFTDKSEQSLNERDRYLVASEDGFKIIECETGDQQLRVRIGQIIRTLIKDSSRRINYPSQAPYLNHLGFQSQEDVDAYTSKTADGIILESIRYNSPNGGIRIAGDGSVIRTEGQYRNEGNPIKDVRLVSNPDPDLVSNIMRLNKNRVEEEKNVLQKVKEGEQAKVDNSVRSAGKVDEVFS